VVAPVELDDEEDGRKNADRRRREGLPPRSKDPRDGRTVASTTAAPPPCCCFSSFDRNEDKEALARAIRREARDKENERRLLLGALPDEVAALVPPASLAVAAAEELFPALLPASLVPAAVEVPVPPTAALLY
jgi:hypothetical protein